jgi:hypothetical protein
MSKETQVAVRLSPDLVEALDDLVHDTPEATRSSVLRDLLREEASKPSFVVGCGHTDPFETTLERVPYDDKGPLVEVRDTLDLAHKACKSEFGRAFTVDTVLQVTRMMLEARDREYARKLQAKLIRMGQDDEDEADDE